MAKHPDAGQTEEQTRANLYAPMPPYPPQCNGGKVEVALKHRLEKNLFTYEKDRYMVLFKYYIKIL